MNFFIFFCSILISIPSYSQQELERVKVTKEISIKVPTAFVPMSVGDRNNKYVSYRSPIAMFTSEDGLIDLGINRNSTEWTENDLKILKSFYKANIQNLFTEVKFLQDDIIQVSDREFVVFEFISKMSDEEKTFGGISAPVSKYTYIVYTLYEDSVLLFNFSCDVTKRPQWQSTAREIMESIRIK